MMLWIAIVVIAILVEILTPSALVSIWFACGALIACFLQLLGLDFTAQVVAFFIVSIVSMIVIRPIATRYLRGNTVATNADRLIGEVATVTKEIEEQRWGEVMINATYWSAVEVNGKKIKKDTRVKVLAIEGAKLIVKEL